MDRLRDTILSTDSLEDYLICELLNTLSAVVMPHDSVLCKFTIDIDINNDRLTSYR